MTFNEYCIQWAAQKGSGLPLTAKEFCNAVYQYAESVSKNLTDALNDVISQSPTVEGGTGITVTKNANVNTVSIDVQGLADVVEGSDTVVIDISEDGEHLEVHLDADVVQKIERAILLPVTAPTQEVVPVVGTNNAVSYKAYNTGGSGGTTLYKHEACYPESSGGGLWFTTISTTEDPYTNAYDASADINNILEMYVSDVSVSSTTFQRLPCIAFAGPAVYYLVPYNESSTTSTSSYQLRVGIKTGPSSLEDTVTRL